MTIRKLTTEDYGAMYALWMSCRGMGLNSVDDSEAGIARFLERNPETSFAAEDDRGLAGVIMAGHDGRRGYIYHTAVSPDRRGEGIGKALVEAALDALRRQGISKVGLVAFRRNEAGNAFWARMGFEERSDLYYHSRALVEMERIDT